MNICKKCGNSDMNTITIVTETNFGHGDSTHTCHVECEACENSSDTFSGYGKFDEITFRKAQADWNSKNA